jgi:putative transposase
MKPDSFPSDLTDEQWAVVEPLIPRPAGGGRKRTVDTRAVVNAIRYLRATNCGWRNLPDPFPHPSTVRHYYDAWRQSGVWQQIEKALATPEGAAHPHPFSRGEDAPTGREDAPKPDDATS